MAFIGIMCTEAEIDQRSGANVSLAFTADMKTAATLAAESIVNALTFINFSDLYSSLNVDKKYILTEIVASMVAIQAIAYDMSGYTSRVEAEDIINILRDNINRAMGILREHDQKGFVESA